MSDFVEWCDALGETIVEQLGASDLRRTSTEAESSWTYRDRTTARLVVDATGKTVALTVNDAPRGEFSLKQSPSMTGAHVAGLLVVGG